MSNVKGVMSELISRVCVLCVYVNMRALLALVC